MNRKMLPRLLLVAVSCCLGGCETMPTLSRVTPQAAFLANEDVEIASADGSWTFKSGEAFVPPSTAGQSWIAEYLGRGGDALTAYSDDMRDTPAGYHKVTISKRGYDKPFYGVLLFSRVFETGDALAKRRWQVAIPEQYFRSATNGGVSLVFGPYGYKRWVGDSWDGYRLQNSRRNATSWVLWMSDLPLW